ncbi:hypothetical protein AVEN_179813-1 [Araneus ventricosus]|uniref:Uncharacterized protein n=1 Tax=Araneus ventricosus TaxID=182803 RepID=A0A4Y2F915_ARAVE|nr:hypothetical protein AVEN_179813-1 [Araneus ventricosus]
MLSVSHYTHLHSGLDFWLHIVQYGKCYGGAMRRRRSYNVGGGVAYTFPFMCPHKKKSNGVKSGERGATLRNHYTRLLDSLMSPLGTA